MMDTFQNKYRIPSACAGWGNYGWKGACFINICTKNRQPFFGEIQSGSTKLLPQGIVANVLWHQIPNHARHIKLGAFVVLPNHVPVVLILNDLGNEDSAGINAERACPVSTNGIAINTTTNSCRRYRVFGRRQTAGVSSPGRKP